MNNDVAAAFAICISNDGYEAALIPRKLYTILSDEKGGLGLVRVIDESGEDYLYPRTMFKEVDLPAETVEAVQKAG